MADEERTGETAEQTLLREIREDFSYYRDYWREQQEEMKTDLRFVAGDPWESGERQAREDNHRPVLSPDELGQYLNAAINNLRQNKRAIKVNPASEGATNPDAEKRAAIISGIEYRSNAQQAYTNAFENALNCGLGFFRVSTRRVRNSKDIEPCIRIIENPLSVLPDPDAKEPDFSDQKRCFVIDTMRKSDFARKYPKAEKKSFEPADAALAPDWFHGENIMVAEYWRIDDYDADGQGGTVTQYVTNGLEILEENEWPGSWIPVVVVAGKQVFVPKGGNVQRQYYSMIRKARGPQMMLAYIASQEAEEYGMAPRAPFVGYVGQFNTDKDAWDTLNKVPRAYVQIDPVTDVGNGQILPPPTRPAFVPNAQAYEIGFERWRRSIQAAMGITPLPSAAQRQNEKSGVALERIQTQQDIGAYHFTDNFDRALEFAGRQIDELITEVMDTPRQVQARHPNEKHELMQIAPNGQGANTDLNPDNVFDPQKGEFDVTITTGPSYQSQRDEQNDFVDLLTQNLAQIPPPGSPQAKILALGIRMKNMGPIADEIADFLDPQQNQAIPPQVQAQMAQMQQTAGAMGQELQKLQLERQGKVIEHQGKMQQIQLQSQADMALEKMKLENALAIAEAEAKSQDQQQREQTFADMMAQFHSQAHEIASQAAAQAHEKAMAQIQAQQQSQLAAQNAQAQSAQSAQDAAQSRQAAQAQAEPE